MPAADTPLESLLLPTRCVFRFGRPDSQGSDSNSYTVAPRSDKSNNNTSSNKPAHATYGGGSIRSTFNPRTYASNKSASEVFTNNVFTDHEHNGHGNYDPEPFLAIKNPTPTRTITTTVMTMGIREVREGGNPGGVDV